MFWITVQNSEKDIVILPMLYEPKFNTTYLRHATLDDFNNYPITIFAKHATVHGKIDIKHGMSHIEHRTISKCNHKCGSNITSK